MAARFLTMEQYLKGLVDRLHPRATELGRRNLDYSWRWLLTYCGALPASWEELNDGADYEHIVLIGAQAAALDRLADFLAERLGSGNLDRFNWYVDLAYLGLRARALTPGQPVCLADVIDYYTNGSLDPDVLDQELCAARLQVLAGVIAEAAPLVAQLGQPGQPGPQPDRPPP